MSCRIVTLNGNQVQSQAWEDIRANVPSDEEADGIYNNMLEDDFMNWYGENWTVTGTEPIVTNIGVQNIYGELKSFKTLISSVNGLNDNNVDYNFKSIQAITSNLPRVEKLFNQLGNTDTFWNKIQQDLQIPKEQITLLKESEGNTIDEKLTSFVANYSYTIEINTAREPTVNKNVDYERDGAFNEDGNFQSESATFSYDGFLYEKSVRHYPFGYGKIKSEDGYIGNSEWESISEMAYNSALKEYINIEGNEKPTQHYSNLTVPGGTNYTENEIATPAITPSIKGHAQFATDNGIGWFRSDDQETINREKFTIEGSKTRRILEVQSDLFQKGRDKKDLIGGIIEEGIFNPETGEWDTPKDWGKEIPSNEQQNQFLQLLNKDNNWVTFFVKSIIQDSAKKGYEKVLFPKGNTASKIEGHSTLEEFKKQKEDRITTIQKEIDRDIEAQKRANKASIENQERMVRESDKEWQKQIHRDKIKDLQKEEFLPLQNKVKEINQLKQELERVEKEGFAALRPIYKFYEETVGNILKKLYKNLLEEITDEYGNSWYSIKVETPSTIYFQQDQNSQENTNYKFSNLDNKLKQYIEDSGLSIEVVNEIKTKLGNSANAVVNFLDKTLQLVEGKVKEDTLPEEAAHIYTQILKTNSPELYKAMYNRIINYKEYKDVKEQYNEVYETEEDFRFEAIGKLIAQRIIQKSNNTDTFIVTWWNNVKNFIKNLLGLNLQQFQDYFDLGADSILNSDGVYKLESTKGRFYQLDSFNWTSTVEKIKSVDAKLEKRLTTNEAGETRDFYYNTEKAREVKKRVTEEARKKVGYTKEFSKEEKTKNEKKAAFGTKAHSAAQNIIERYVANKSGKLVPTKSTEVSSEIYNALESYTHKIINLPQFEGAVFIAEPKVYDESRDLAGTVDWIILDKTGVAHILDFKFITGEKGKRLFVKATKAKEWNEQINSYKGILNTYGINKFGMLRMLPISVTYNENTEPVSIEVQGESLFEKSVPSTEERTNSDLDILIDKLYKDAQKLREDKRIAYADKEDRLRAIEKSINDILIKKDLTTFKRYLDVELNNIEKDLELDEITSERAKEISQLVDYYSEIDNHLGMPELKDLALRAREIKGIFPSKLVKWAEERKLNYGYFKPISGALVHLTALGSIANPVFKYLNKLYQRAEDNKESRLRTFIESIKDLKLDADRLLEKKDGKYTGKLISRYSKEFFNLLEKATPKWIAENVRVLDTIFVNGKEYNAKDYFEKEVARKKAYLGKILTPQQVEEEIDKYRKFNDFWSDKYRDRAISYYNGRNMFIRPSDKWFTEEYKALVENKDSDNAKFYNIIQDLINEAKQYTTGNDIDIKFIPFIEKSLMSKVFNGNLNSDKILSHLTDHYKIKDYDNTKGDREIKLRYLQQINPENQNLDLKEVYTLFADSVFNVKYKSEIEADAYLGGKLLETGKYIKLNGVGNPELDSNRNIIFEEVPNKATKENYDSFVDSLIYNIKDRTDIKVGELSGAKMLNSALAYNSFLRIGFNVLSASANVFGGNANLIIEGFKGKFFTNKDLAKAKSLFWSRNSKAMALINYFDVATDNNINKRSREIAESKLDKIFNMDWIMKMQEIGEKEVQYSTLLAFLEGYTVKEGKLTKKLSGDKSLIDLTEVKDGKVTIPEFTEDSFNRVRLAITELNTRLTGARSDRNKMLYQNHGYLRLLTQFKSWVLPMGKERFGSLTYNSNLDMYEEGRFTAMFHSLVNRHWKESTMGLLKSIATFNVKALSMGAEKALRERYQVMIKVNPNFDPDLNPESGITFEAYQAIFEQNVRAMVGEMVLLCTILIAALKLTGDDDDKNSTKVRMLERFYNELTYFYNIQSYLDLGGISVPLLSTANDFGKLATTLLEDSWMIASGESEEIDTQQLRKAVSRPIWGFRQYDNIIDILNLKEDGKN